MGADFYETPAEIKDNEREGRPNIGIGEGSVIEGAIIDKNARIGRQVIIRNMPDREDHEEDNWVAREGIVIVPKNATVFQTARLFSLSPTVVNGELKKRPGQIRSGPFDLRKSACYMSLATPSASWCAFQFHLYFGRVLKFKGMRVGFCGQVSGSDGRVKDITKLITACPHIEILWLNHLRQMLPTNY